MAENAMALDTGEQGEMQLVADSLAPEDFGIGQLFWEIRDAVVVGDAETGRIVLWNPEAVALFGIPVAEALGQSIEILVPELFRERHRAGLARFRKTGSGSIIESGRTVELPALRRCGEQITIQLTL
jgi:PAS domain S-box-containing protein